MNSQSHTREQTPARTDSQAWADKNARIPTHPREGCSKWTSQPSKVLTSIRHAYTVRLPTDSESHLSARASAKQFQSEENHFMHICIHRERACQTRWLSSRSSPFVLFTAIVKIVKWFVLIEWLFLVMMIYLHETVVAQVRKAEHQHRTSHLGIWGLWKLASMIPRKLWDFLLPEQRLKST